MCRRDCSCKVHCGLAWSVSRNRTARCSPGRYPSIRRCRSRGKHNRVPESQEGNDCPTWHFRGPTRYRSTRTQLLETTVLWMLPKPEQAFRAPSQRQEPNQFEKNIVGKNNLHNHIAT